MTDTMHIRADEFHTEFTDDNQQPFYGVHVISTDGSSQFVSASQISMLAELLAIVKAKDADGLTIASNRSRVINSLHDLKRQFKADR